MFLTANRKQYLAVALAALAAASMWFYVKLILIPHQVQDAAQVGRPRGNLSDLYPRWLGARELLLHHRDPYSPEVTRDIQRGVYGRALDPSRTNDPKDEQAFAYPVYVAFLLAPTLGIAFQMLRPIFSAMLVVLVILVILLWNFVLGTKLSWAGILVAVLLALGSFPIVQGIRLQQLTIVVAALLASSFLARRMGSLLLSGFLMALATIKPQIALLPVLAMILWAISDWATRKRWLGGFFATMGILLAASEYTLPGWIPKFVRGLHDYQRYTGSRSLLEAFLSPGVGTVLGYLLLVYAVWMSWRARNSAPDSVEGRHLVCLLLTAMVCATPNATYNQVFLLPALLVFSQQNVFKSNRMLVRSFAWLTAVLLVWPWLVCIPLMATSSFFTTGGYARVWQVPLYGTLQLPLAILALLLVLRKEAGVGGRSLASVPRGVSCSL